VYKTRKKEIESSNKIDDMLEKSGDLYSDIVVWFWRYVRRKEHWISKSDMQRWRCKSGDWLGLHSQSVQAVADQFYDALQGWFNNKESDPNHNPPKSRKKRNKVIFKSSAIRKRDGELILSRGQYKDSIVVEWDHGEPKRVELIEENGRPVLCCQYEVEPEDKTTGSRTAGLDLGEKHLAAIYVDGEDPILLNGGEYRAKQRYREKTKAKIQSKIDRKQKGSNRFGRLVETKNKQLGSLNNQIKDILHKYSRKLVSHLIDRGVDTLVVEDLKGLRQNLDMGKRMNQRLHQWVFGSFLHMIEYKCRLVGIDVERVDPEYTSQMCPRCRSKNKPTGRKYSCSCGFVGHRDTVGAFNVLEKYTDSGPLIGAMASPTGVRFKPHMLCSSDHSEKESHVL
jgi:putative transposase